MLEGKTINLGLTPQDFFTTRKRDGKETYAELEMWFSSHFGNAAIPIIDVRNSCCALAWMIFDENGSIFAVSKGFLWKIKHDWAFRMICFMMQ
jgi:hypothetical protein